jgi:hypothetical protein
MDLGFVHFDRAPHLNMKKKQPTQEQQIVMKIGEVINLLMELEDLFTKLWDLKGGGDVGD